MEFILNSSNTTQIILIAILAIPTLVLYFYCLFHAATNRSMRGLHRLLWFFLILSMPLLGCVAYWMIGRTLDIRRQPPLSLRKKIGREYRAQG